MEGVSWNPGTLTFTALLRSGGDNSWQVLIFSAQAEIKSAWLFSAQAEIIPGNGPEYR